MRRDCSLRGRLRGCIYSLISLHFNNHSFTHQFYDHFTNECIDTRFVISQTDLKNIREGKYDNNVLNLKPQNRGYKVSKGIIIMIKSMNVIRLDIIWLLFSTPLAHRVY